MHYQISIHNPCSEDWDKMSPRTDGRHCDSCGKTVNDFSGWNNDQILGYLLQNPDTCGRIREETNFSIVKFVPERKKQQVWKRWMLIACIPLVIQTAAYTQNTIPQCAPATMEQREARDTAVTAVVPENPFEKLQTPVVFQLINSGDLQFAADRLVQIFRNDVCIISQKSDSLGIVIISEPLKENDLLFISGELHPLVTYLAKGPAADHRYHIYITSRKRETFVLGQVAVQKIEIIEPPKPDQHMMEMQLMWELERMMMR